MRLTEEDGARVAAAIRAAEARTDGEVSAIVAQASDSYADVVLHWSLLLALLPLAWSTAFPTLATYLAAVGGSWDTPPPLPLVLGILLAATVLFFLAGRLLVGLSAVRMTLVPAGTRARRVRRRALLLFRTGTEQRTASHTGVLLYLSFAERRAEIVADRSIHAKVDPARWGEAMQALLAHVREGRTSEGMAVAIGMIGDVLAEQFPHTGTDPNELPDRLIQL